MRSISSLCLFCATAGLVTGQQLVNVSLHATAVPVNEPINPTFVGLSIEVPSAVEMIGRHSYEGPRQSLLNLLENFAQFTPSAEELATIRVGGNSADESVFNPRGDLPIGKDYSITWDDIYSYRAFSELSNRRVSFVLGLNFQRAANASWAVGEVQAVQQAVGWAALGPNSAIEIGNECDIFNGNGIRNSSYTYSQYADEFETYASAVKSVGLPPLTQTGGGIQGATFCCEHADFDNGFATDYVTRFKSVLGTNSYHRYPTNHCGSSSTSLAALLSPRSSEGQAEYLSRFSIASRAQGTPFVIGESNSVACGGQDGVSNVMGTALWAVDYLLNLARINVTAINFHGGPKGRYQPIGYNSTGAGAAPDVRPLYYGALLFSEAVANRSQLLNLTMEHTDNAQVRTWMARDGDTGGLRLVVVHKDPNATEPANVRFDLGAGAQAGDASTPCSDGQLVRLQSAGGVLSTYGLSIAGQTFDGSQDGRAVGKRVTESVHCNAAQSGGEGASSWEFTVQPGTIALLHLPLPTSR